MFIEAAIFRCEHGLHEIGRHLAERHGGRGAPPADADFVSVRIEHRDRKRIRLRRVEGTLEVGQREENKGDEAGDGGGESERRNGEDARTSAGPFAG